MLKKYLMFILFFAGTFFCLRGEPKYLFFQEEPSDVSMISPMMNLKLLESYKFDNFTWRVKPAWFFYGFKNIKSFLDSFEAISDFEARKNYPNIVNFFTSAIEHGPVFPHFYNKSGEFTCKSFSGVNSVAMFPYFLVDIDAFKGVVGSCDCTLFNLQNKLFIKDGSIKFPFYKVVDEPNANKFIPCEMGWYKLMLLRLGIDRENNLMKKDNSEFGIYKELDSLVNKSVDNPWHSNNFSKEKFLQYEIAKIFKQNRSLFEKAKLAVDFFLTPWKIYENLKIGKYFKKNGVAYSFDEIKSFLPGEEQILSYYFVQNLMLLWYGANSDVIWGIDGIRIPGLFRLYKRFAFSKFSMKGAEKVKVFSFMDVWKKLREELNKNARKDWVSFSGHGVVISFDEEIIRKQNEVVSVSDKELLEFLGFALIDSCFGEKLNLFYKEPSEASEKSLGGLVWKKAKQAWQGLKNALPSRVR